LRLTCNKGGLFNDHWSARLNVFQAASTLVPVQELCRGDFLPGHRTIVQVHTEFFERWLLRWSEPIVVHWICRALRRSSSWGQSQSQRQKSCTCIQFRVHQCRLYVPYLIRESKGVYWWA
jgi:hypothetical protein